MNNQNQETPKRGFTTEPGTYPTVLYTDDLMDCQPAGNGRSYIHIDKTDDDEWIEEHDGSTAEYQIPNRIALYQLIADISTMIKNNIQGYLKLNTTPGDDTTDDIHNSIYLLKELQEFDRF